MNIREYLKKHILITDGAMGTYYSMLTDDSSLVSEYANLSDTDIIKRIHKEYIEAGAALIRTNTFAAYSYMFDNNKEKTKECIEAAVAVAKEAVKEAAGAKKIFIAGDIGPVAGQSAASEEEIFEEYKLVADTLAENSTDLILMETFPDTLYQIKLAKYIKSRYPDMFIMAQISADASGHAAGGANALKLLKELRDCEDIDAYGLNCGMGSGHMLEFVRKSDFVHDKYFCVAPNAGYPEHFGSRMVFVNNAAYFAKNIAEMVKCGVAVAGACCGSTPEYIKAVSTAVSEAEKGTYFSRKNNDEKISENEADINSSTQKKTGHAAAATEILITDSGCNTCFREDMVTSEPKLSFIEKLRAGKKVVACELDPPFNADDSKIIASATKLARGGKTDIITFADSPMGKSRVDSIHMANKIKHLTGMEVMPHICCRDKNMIAMRSQLLGAHVNDIRNLLVVTGDPVPGAARSNTTAVFDYNSIKLMGYIKTMNEEHFPEDMLVYGGALNYAGKNPDAIVERMKKKIDAGAEFFLSQPVYSKEDVERIYLLKNRVNTKILCGIMPLVSYKNAMFIKNEVAGINVPDDIAARYSPDMSREEAELVAADISNSIIKELSEAADGYYMMLQFNRAGLMDNIEIV